MITLRQAIYCKESETMRISISWEGGELFAQLEDTPTAKAIVAALPHTAQANTWGEEVYFTLPATVEREANATDVVDPGTICYWVQGSSLALPYGPTPASTGNECRLVTSVNLLGKLEGDPSELSRINDGDSVTVSVAS
jgi:hypothetical protein